MTEKQLVDMYVPKVHSKLNLFGLKIGSVKREYLMYGDTYMRLMATMKRLCTKAEKTLDDSVGNMLEVTHYEPSKSLTSTNKIRWELCRIDGRLCWRRL